MLFPLGAFTAVIDQRCGTRSGPANDLGAAAQNAETAAIVRLTYRVSAVACHVIKSCSDKRTERFIAGDRVKDFEGFADQARRRLAVLAAATRIEDLAGLPSNKLEMSSGDRA